MVLIWFSTSALRPSLIHLHALVQILALLTFQSWSPLCTLSLDSFWPVSFLRSSFWFWAWSIEYFLLRWEPNVSKYLCMHKLYMNIRYCILSGAEVPYHWNTSGDTKATRLWSHCIPQACCLDSSLVAIEQVCTQHLLLRTRSKWAIKKQVGRTWKKLPLWKQLCGLE